jgi:hypothetical protein
MPATDLPGLKDVRWFVLILASASLALYPVHTAGKSFGASPTKLAFQFAKLLVAWLTDSVEKRLEVTKPAKALRQIMLAGICLTLVAVDTEHSWICASAGKRGAKPHGLTYSR